MQIALVGHLPGWVVDRAELVGGIQLLHVEPEEHVAGCDTCGRDASALSRHGRVTVDYVEQPCAGLPTRLRVARRRYRCRPCRRVVGEDLPLTIPSPRFTRRCVAYVREQYPLIPTISLARRIGADDTAVRAVGEGVAPRSLGRPKRRTGEVQECAMCLRVMPVEMLEVHHPSPSRTAPAGALILCPECHKQHALSWLENAR